MKPKETREKKEKTVGSFALPIEGTLSAVEITWLEKALASEMDLKFDYHVTVDPSGIIKIQKEETPEEACLSDGNFFTNEILFRAVRNICERTLNDHELPQYEPFQLPSVNTEQTTRTTAQGIRKRLAGLWSGKPGAAAEVPGPDISELKKQHDAGQVKALSDALQPKAGELGRQIRAVSTADQSFQREKETLRPVRRLQLKTGTARTILINFKATQVEATAAGTRITSKLDGNSKLDVFVQSGDSYNLKYGLDGIRCSVDPEGNAELKVERGEATISCSEKSE